MVSASRPALRASLQAAVAVAGTHPAIPKTDRMAVRLWSLGSGIIMIAGIVYAFFGGWYWALLGIVAWFIVSGANRRSAAQMIVETASTNDAFKGEMLHRGILIEG